MAFPDSRTRLEYFYERLDKICQSATQLLDAKAGSIYLMEPNGKLRMRAGAGYTRVLVGRAEYSLGEGITGWIGLGNVLKADSRGAIESHPKHAGKYDRNQWGDKKKSYCWSAVGLPLRLGEQLFGVIKVENKATRTGKPCAFTNEDISRLEIFTRAILDGILADPELLRVLGSLYVFVLIPFNPKYKNIYEFGIKQTVVYQGLRCERADEIQSNDDILRTIYNSIASADIVIAEMTDRNPNVFYETGYAHALAKRTILLAQDAADIPFDLNHYNHLIYDANDLEALRRGLGTRLAAIRQEIVRDWMPANSRPETDSKRKVKARVRSMPRV